MNDLKGSDSTMSFQYNEYVRLADKADDYARAAMGDIALLGAVGAVLAWPPLAPDLDDEKSYILFIGFLVVLFITLGIGIINSLRESVMYFYIKESVKYGRSLQTPMNDGNQKYFDIGQQWRAWYKNSYHIRLHGMLIGAFGVIVIGFPTTFLFLVKNHWQGISYLIVSGLGMGPFLLWKCFFIEKCLKEVEDAAKFWEGGEE